MIEERCSCIDCANREERTEQCKIFKRHCCFARLIQQMCDGEAKYFVNKNINDIQLPEEK